jgi:Protein of unknown function (DUF3037)
MSYQFSLIRFVPDPARGEFVNIGAIVGDEESDDWDLRFLSNYRRAKALDARGSLPAAMAFATALDERVDTEGQLEIAAQAPMTVEQLQALADESQNIVQFTVPTPVVADTSEQALDLIFEQLVLDPTSHEFRFEKKHRAQSATRRAYRDHEVPEDSVEERARIESGVFDATFDFAVHNGHAVQLVQCWSFQLPNQDDLAEQVKAWSWVVHEVRNRGGALEVNGGTLEVPDTTEIAAVYIPPLEENGGAPAFEEAQAAFEENDVQPLTPDQADQLGEAARRLLVPG